MTKRVLANKNKRKAFVSANPQSINSKQRGVP